MKKAINLLKKLDEGQIVTINGRRFLKREDNLVGLIILETKEEWINMKYEISLNDFIKLCEEKK